MQLFMLKGLTICRFNDKNVIKGSVQISADALKGGGGGFWACVRKVC